MMTAEEAMEQASDEEKPILELLISYSPIMSNRLKLDAARGIIKLRTPTPSDEVAQRARIAAEEIERVYDRDTTEIEEVEAIISKHFTATDG